jgi:hypothetical protein
MQTRLKYKLIKLVHFVDSSGTNNTATPRTERNTDYLTTCKPCLHCSNEDLLSFE